MNVPYFNIFKLIYTMSGSIGNTDDGREFFIQDVLEMKEVQSLLVRQKVAYCQLWNYLWYPNLMNTFIETAQWSRESVKSVTTYHTPMARD